MGDTREETSAADSSPQIVSFSPVLPYERAILVWSFFKIVFLTVFFFWFQCFGDTLWSILEAEEGPFPNSIKAILKACKYDDLFVLANWNESDSKFVEKYLQNDFHEIISDEEREIYYGLYKNNPNKFKLLAPDLKTLERISKAAKSVHTANKKRTVQTPSPAPSSKRIKIKPVTASSGQSLEENQNDANKVTEAKSLLETNIKKWLRTNVPELANNTLKICIVLGSPLSAQVACPAKACEYVGTMTYQKGTTWQTSNFYKHLSRIHVKAKKGNIKDFFDQADENKFPEEEEEINVPKRKGSRSQVISSDDEDNSTSIDEDFVKMGDLTRPNSSS